MYPYNFIVLELLCQLAGLIFVVVGAVFGFYEVLRNDQNDPVRRWFRKGWRTISESIWMQLLPLSLQWMLAIKHWLGRFSFALSRPRSITYLFACQLFLCAAIHYILNERGGFIVIALTSVLYMIYILFCYIEPSRTPLIRLLGNMYKLLALVVVTIPVITLIFRDSLILSFFYDNNLSAVRSGHSITIIISG